MEELPVLLTTAQVARRLKMHPATLRRWADKGWLRSIRLPNGHRKFREEDIRAKVAEIYGTEEAA